MSGSNDTSYFEVWWIILLPGILLGKLLWWLLVALLWGGGWLIWQFFVFIGDIISEGREWQKARALARSRNYSDDWAENVEPWPTDYKAISENTQRLNSLKDGVEACRSMVACWNHDDREFVENELDLLLLRAENVRARGMEQHEIQALRWLIEDYNQAVEIITQEHELLLQEAA